MKKFLLFSLSITLLFGCAVGGFKLWESEKTNKQEFLDYNKRRQILTGYYLDELQRGYVLVLDKSSSEEDKTAGRKCIDEAKINMLKDEYNQAEINLIRSSSMDFVANDFECKEAEEILDFLELYE